MAGDNPQCDFCCSPDVRWVHPAEDFTFEAGHGLPTYGSEGAWAACQACHIVIKSGDREKLARRCAKRFHKMHPQLSFKHTLTGTREGQARFWAARNGEPRPYTPADAPALAARQARKDPVFARGGVSPAN